MERTQTKQKEYIQQTDQAGKTRLIEDNENTPVLRTDDTAQTAGEPTEDKTTADSCGSIPCSIEKALDVLGGKWTFLIIRDLFSGTKRFGELRQSLGGVSPKTLSARLRQLEKQNIVERRAFATIPPTVQYTLTAKGRSLKPIIKAMKAWGAKWG